MKPDLSILDAAIHSHHGEGKGRGTLKIKGFSKAEIDQRWNVLTRDGVKPLVRVGAKEPKGGWDEDEDGLLRLIKGRKLTIDQANQGVHIRRLARAAELAGGPVKLSNPEGLGGGKCDGLPSDGDIGQYLRAKQELFRLRWVVLHGEPEMLNVIDGIVIAGKTHLTMAAGDGRRARELLFLLRATLSLLHLAANPPVKPPVHEHA